MGRSRILICAGIFSLQTTVSAADWQSLQRYQQSISRIEFEQLLDTVFCPSQSIRPYLSVADDAVAMYSTPAREGRPLFILTFASTVSVLPERPALRGLRIAIDPGHIGGEWARMEERFFVKGGDRPVQEGVLTLMVARLLKSRLETEGASVFLTRSELKPITDKRPADFWDAAVEWVATQPKWQDYPPLEREAAIAAATRQRAEQLFYRSAEIRDRAQLINERIKPDVTLCVHFNAVEWDECQNLVDDNRLLFFVHGNYLADEIAEEDQRLRLMQKLLARTVQTERGLANQVASEFVRETGLPPVTYADSRLASPLGDNPYVYARNLAANRLFDGPVVYLEPYYMNSRVVYQRLQLGDYEGTREINGGPVPSIFREYADAVVRGLVAYYGGHAPR